MMDIYTLYIDSSLPSDNNEQSVSVSAPAPICRPADLKRQFQIVSARPGGRVEVRPLPNAHDTVPLAMIRIVVPAAPTHVGMSKAVSGRSRVR